MKRIPLSRGKFALVDDEDFEFLMQWKWYVLDTNYVVRNRKRSEGTRQLVYMHRVIGNAPVRFEIDHINNNRLDNRRENLRVCTRQQNSANMSLAKTNTSGFRGVTWENRRNTWIAQIKVNQKHFYIGSSNNIKEAAKMYIETAKKHFGEFAKVNQI